MNNDNSAVVRESQGEVFSLEPHQTPPSQLSPEELSAQTIHAGCGSPDRLY